MHRVNRNAIIQFILVLTVIAVAVTPVLSDSPPGRGLSKTHKPAEMEPWRHRPVKFEGRIVALPADGGPSLIGIWRIRELTGTEREATVTKWTRIVPPLPPPAVGDWVRVFAQRQEFDDPLVADRIIVQKGGEGRARPLQVRGEIEVLPSETITGTWVVNGVTLRVDSRTMIHPDRLAPEIGMLANVIALEQLDSILWAKNITLHSPKEEKPRVKFEGTIESLPEEGLLGAWVVNSTTVTVTTDTKLKGATPVVGLEAEVEGVLQEDGAILATEVEVEEPESEKVEFEGEIESLPVEGTLGTWIVAGTTVLVTEDTKLKGVTTAVGLQAEVEGILQADGSVLATEVEVEASDDEDDSDDDD